MPSTPAQLANSSIMGGYVNAANDTPTQAVTGMADPGNTIMVYDNGTQIGTAIADATTGAWSYTLGVLSEAAHSLTAIATDGVNSISMPSAPLDFTVDTTAPAAPTTLADTAIGNGYVNAANDTAAQALTGTAEAGSLITVYDNGAQIGTAIADATTGAWSYTLGVLSEAAHSLTATATDAAGNVGAASAALTFTVDTTAPTLSVSGPAAPVEATSAAGAAVSFTGSATDAVDGTDTVGFSEHGQTVHSGDVFSLGSHTVTATTMDAAGNPSSSDITFDVVDTTAPTLSVTGPAAPVEATSAAGAAVSFTGSATDAVDGTDTVGFSEHGQTVHSGDVFSLGSHTVTATTMDAAGNPSSSDITFDVVDTTAPTLSVSGPAAPVEATSAAGAAVSFTGSATDAVDGTDTVGFSEHGQTVHSGDVFSLGSHTVTATTMDAAGNPSSSDITFDVVDTTAPTLSVSGPAAPVEATSAAGAAVSFTGSATDAVDGTDTVGFSEHGQTVHSGDVFSLGSHTVTATTMDAAGNPSSSDITFDVVDTTAPTLSVSGPAAPVEATSAAGAAVSFTGSATDAVDGTDTVGFSEHGQTVHSGDVFSLGSHTVTATTMDAAGNPSSSDITFDVVDTTAPTLSVSGPAAPVEATSAAGAAVSFTGSATDAVDGTDTVGFSEHGQTVHSGDVFSLGSHTVTATTMDAAGNPSSSDITFDVVDTTAPTLSVSGPAAPVEATSAAGAAVSFTGSATDAVDGTDTVGFSEHGQTVHSGDVFSLGSHTVTATTMDAAGNPSSSDITFDVVDTTAPTLSVTGPAAPVEATSAAGAAVSFTGSATDAVDGTDTVGFSEHGQTVHSGDVFSLGSHTVTATTMDAAGNPSSSDITFDVVDTTAPTLSVSGPAAPVEATSAAGAAVSFTGSATDAVDGTDTVGFSEHGQTVHSGDVFSLGSHTVTATTMDAAGNPSSSDITFDVVDTTAPTLSVTGPAAPVEATSAAGAAVSFTGSATDAVDGTDTVGFSEHGQTVHSGDVFSLGSHTVTATTMDAAGNPSSSDITFDVVDTTAPTLSVTGPAAPVEATSAAGAAVSFTGSATDAVDGTDTVGFSEHGQTVHSGDVFSLGSHTVTATTMDAAGNPSSSDITFDVVDTTAPTLSVSGPAAPVEATSAAGAAVSFTGSATDAVDGTDTVGFSEHGQTVHSGDVFSLGSHTVTATTMDAAGNPSSSDITFDVVDTTATVITSHGGLTNIEHQTVSGTALAGSTLQLLDNGEPIGNPTLVTDDGHWNVDVTLANGTHSLTAAGAPGSGYGSSPSSAVDYTVLPNVDPVTNAVLPAIDPDMSGGFQITNATLGLAGGNMGESYNGPVSYLQHQLIWSGTEGIAVSATMADVFLHGGTGDDALQVTSGSNVLDGGDGSNFLVGASGADGGSDTFFVDARTSAPTWSTVVNFHAGDKLAIWGFAGESSDAAWVGQGGADGFTGATLRAQVNGHDSSVTFAGLNDGDAAGLSVTTGSVEGQNYLLITRAS